MHLLSVNVSTARSITIDGREVLTAIGKRGVSGPVEARPLGLEGDEQADQSVHGGLSKAIYAYPAAHYAFWQTVRAQARVAAKPANPVATTPVISSRRLSSSVSVSWVARKVSRSRARRESVTSMNWETV